MVGPVGQIRGREDVVVGHGKPSLLRGNGADDVVGWIEIDTVTEDSGRGIGGILVADHRVLSCGGESGGRQYDGKDPRQQLGETIEKGSHSVRICFVFLLGKDTEN